MSTTPTALVDAGVRVLDCEHKTPVAQETGHPYVAIPDIQDGRVLLDQARRISDADLVAWTRRTTPAEGDILVTRRGRVGDTAPVPTGRMAIGQNLVLLRTDGTLVDSVYLRWAVRSPEWWSEVDRLMNVGAVFSSLNVKDIGRIKLTFPSLPDQQAIAEVLGALDDKIAANTRLAATADNFMSATLSSVTKVVKPLDTVAEFHNRRRIPLSATEREARPGRVPYHGATGVFGYVDEAIFDTELVLVGEDGSVINPDGTPVTQYVWGPAWVNNHAHVLTGQTISTELLYQVVRTADAGTLVTGAVQPKINMGSLKRLQVAIPMPESLASVERKVQALTSTRRSLLSENRTLAATRDAVLPKLMSGALRVKDLQSVLQREGAS